MRKVFTAAMAAITLGGAVCATAAPAQARPYGYSHYGHYYGHNNAGAAVAAGVVGLALGAAIASNHSYHNRGYYGGYYGGGYYDGGYYGGGYYPAYGYAYAPPAYRVCESTRWVWDPYIGRNVPVASRYAC